MSIGYVSLWRLDERDDQVAYEVRSCDFATVPGEEVVIGYLYIERAAGTYSFEAAGALAGTLVVPPAAFELEEAEVVRQLKSQYKDHDAIPWMRRLSRVARFLIQQGTFPERYPRE